MTSGENSAPQLPRAGADQSRATGAAAGAGTGSFFRQCDSTEPVSTAQSDQVAHQLHKVRYETLGEIGRGGMGAILKVLDRDLSRSVAMKVMLSKDDERRRMRFIEEAQVTGQLEHPNIVPVHEIGFDKNGHPFFTMKLVNGLSLADIMMRLRDGDEQAAIDFPMRKLLKILTDVSNAISYAHHRGVVHRDLKPANIMVGNFGEVLVMDWGLAKVVGEQKPITNRQTRRRASEHPGSDAPVAIPAVSDGSDLVSSVRSESSLNTREGTIAGTPAYMSPEQARGETDRITRRSDVYALGAMLYEVLTLKPPIRSGSARSSIKDAAEGRIIRPEDRAPERNIPSELSAIAMKALSYEPRHRYASMDEFRSDLQRFLNGHSVSAKVDSAWESFVKLVKRNKAASVFTFLGIASAITVSAVAFVINEEALHRAEWKQAQAVAAKAVAEKALASAKEEYLGRTYAQTAASAALVFKARSQIESDEVGEALASADLAVGFDPDSADACALRGQILLAKREFQRASADVHALLKLRPGDPFGMKAQDLCQRGLSAAEAGANDAETISLLIRVDMGHLARAMVSSPADRLMVFRQELEHAWPGASANLTSSADGNLSFEAGSFHQKISDLRIFRGIPLVRLLLRNCAEITDLAPLHGMPLHELDLDQCRKITSLAPLKGMPLVALHLVNCERIGIYDALKDMPLEELDVSEGRQFTNADVAMLARMPLAFLTLRGCSRVDDITPVGSISTLKMLNVATTRVSDLEPLRNLKRLGYLVILQCPIKDLSPIAELTALNSILMPPGKGIPGLKALRQMPRLQKINDLPAQDYWAQIGDIP